MKWIITDKQNGDGGYAPSVNLFKTFLLWISLLLLITNILVNSDVKFKSILTMKRKFKNRTSKFYLNYYYLFWKMEDDFWNVKRK